MDYGPEEEEDYSQQRKKKGDILREEVFTVVFERREEEIRGWRRGSGGSVLQRYFGAVLEERLKRNRTSASPGASMVTFWTIFTYPFILFLPYILSIRLWFLWALADCSDMSVILCYSPLVFVYFDMAHSHFVIGFKLFC